MGTGYGRVAWVSGAYLCVHTLHHGQAGACPCHRGGIARRGIRISSQTRAQLRLRVAKLTRPGPGSVHGQAERGKGKFVSRPKERFEPQALSLRGGWHSRLLASMSALRPDVPLAIRPRGLKPAARWAGLILRHFFSSTASFRPRGLRPCAIQMSLTQMLTCRQVGRQLDSVRLPEPEGEMQGKSSKKKAAGFLAWAVA